MIIMSNLLQSLQEHFDNSSPDQLDKEWKEIEDFQNVGPDVEEYVEFVKKLQETDIGQVWSHCDRLKIHRT